MLQARKSGSCLIRAFSDARPLAATMRILQETAPRWIGSASSFRPGLGCPLGDFDSAGRRQKMK
jgi:hypothetical protein